MLVFAAESENSTAWLLLKAAVPDEVFQLTSVPVVLHELFVEPVQVNPAGAMCTRGNGDIRLRRRGNGVVLEPAERKRTTADKANGQHRAK